MLPLWSWCYHHELERSGRKRGLVMQALVWQGPMNIL